MSVPITFLILSLLLLPHLSRSHLAEASTLRPDCAGRRIYIQPLPSQFNTDLLRTCNSFPIYDPAGFCSSTINHGLGPLTSNRSRSWYRTDPLLLEPFFHRRFLEYPCLTSSPLAADAVFLPYYAALDALPFLYSPALWNSSALHGLPLHHHLKNYTPNYHNHFLVMSRPAWDFSQSPKADPPLWGTSFLTRREFINITALVPESRASPWQERAIPPPTSFHPATTTALDAWLTRARRSPRRTLMLFAGGGGSGGPNIRASIRSECDNRSLSQSFQFPIPAQNQICHIVDCSDGACAHDPARYMRPMLRAKFCLQPPGDTPTRRSTFDAIIAGCIPVFFEELAARSQYRWHLPWEQFHEFSVFIAKEEVVFGGVRIVDVLTAIPEAEVRRMRERVLELAPRVMYRRHGSSAGLRARKDAFDIAVEGALRRIKRRARLLGEVERMLVDDDEMDGRDGGSEPYSPPAPPPPPSSPAAASKVHTDLVGLHLLQTQSLTSLLLLPINGAATTRKVSQSSSDSNIPI